MSRGIAMYESLIAHCKNFHLYIFAFDDVSFDYLSKNSPEQITVISLEEFEDNELLSVKEGRTKGEYCWTSTSSTILYCIEKFELEHCTYLDADLYFFSDPRILLKEVSDGKTLITSHRYTPIYNQDKLSGKYCVQFITFWNNSESMEILRWWRGACIDWCYARAEDGKFGDQKYLDNWQRDFKNVHVLEYIGGGVAPWNLQQYEFEQNNDKIVGIQKSDKTRFELVFYHFHALKFLENNRYELSVYELDEADIEYIYKPYLVHLIKIHNKLNDVGFRNIIQSEENLSLNDYSIIDLIKLLVNDWRIPIRYLKIRKDSKKNKYHRDYFIK